MTTALSELTTLRLGGPPARLVEVRSEDEAVAAVRAADEAGEPLLVLGGGSNVVVADEGFAGTVVHVRTRGVEADGTRFTVQAGEPWDPLVERWVAAGLAGVECLAGIPGSIGATPIQNVGAYGQEVSETIVSVRAYDREAGEVVELAPADCGFAYRSSAFKRTPGRWLILAVEFELERAERSLPLRYGELSRALGVEPGGRAPLEAVREAVLALRRGKGMVLDPGDLDTVSAGSFFTNPILSAPDAERLDGAAPRYPQPDGRVKTSAAWLIERAGYGRGYGDPATIAVSGKHSLALTNRGAGTTRELLALAHEIARAVRERFGIDLTPEPTLVGVSWDGAG